MSPNHRRRLATLVAVATALLAVVLGYLAPSIGRSAALGWYAALAAPWAWLVWRSDDGAAVDWRLLLGLAVGARLALAFAEPMLSDDIYRYVWDGRVAAAGINPFVWAPADPTLAGLRDQVIWPQVNHPEVPTIYPPAAQALFWLNAVLGGGVALLKLLLIGCELALGALVAVVLRRTGATAARLRRALVVYGLCPLVIVEIAWSGHVDVLAWMALAAALVVFMRVASWRAAAAAGVLLGVSVAAKFLGVLALPLLVSDRERWRRGPVAGAVAAGVVALSYLPYLDAGPRLFAGFGTYAASWTANAGGFAAAEALAGWALTSFAGAADAAELVVRLPHLDQLAIDYGFTRQWQGQTVPATSFTGTQLAQTVAKAAGGFVVGVAMLWALVVRPGGRAVDPIGGLLVVLTALYFVAPVVHPWYVAWLVPLAALRRWPPALVFTVVVPVAYLAWVSAGAGGAWVVPAWARAAEFGVVGLAWWWWAGYSAAASQPVP